MVVRIKTPEDWSRALRERTDRSGECWVWTGDLDDSGYGKRGAQRVHRKAWELAYGPIPVGLLVLHRCDNPPCVRPDHLFLGTHADNMRDMVAKGRQNRPAHGSPGERNPRAILTAEQVAEIRQATETHRQVAARYGMSIAAIRDIRQGRRWRSVT